MSELPEGWAHPKLKELVSPQKPLCYGVVQPGGDGGPDGVPLIRVCDLSDGTISSSGVRTISAEVDAQYRRSRLEGGEVLVSLVGTVGRVALVPNSNAGANIARAIARIAPEKVSSKWIAYGLDSPIMKERLIGDAREVARKTLNLSELGNTPLPLPPVNEQKRIVAKIDALTEKSREARVALDEVPQLLDKLRQSILAAAFRGDLTKKWREENPDVEPARVLLQSIRKQRRKKWEEAELAKFKAKGKIPKDDKWKAKYKEPEPVDTEGLPELPEGWCWSSMDALTLMSGGITKGQKRKAEVRTRPVPYLRVANVQRGSLSLEEMAEIEATDEQIAQLRLQPGDLLLNEGGDIDKLGRGWVWRGELETCIHQNHVFRARPLCRDLDPEFISHFTNTFGQRYFLDSGKQTTNLASVSMTRVKACPVPVAPVAEMNAIVTQIRGTLKNVQAGISTHLATSEHLETLDSSILAKAFRGELVPQDPTDEPASVLLEKIRAEREAAGEAKKTRATRKKS